MLVLCLTTVSKYGDRNVTTRTNDLQNPRLLAASTSNEDEKEHLKAVLDDCTSKLAGIQDEVRAAVQVNHCCHSVFCGVS